MCAGDAQAKWNRDVRRGFMRKVLFLVACQLLVTTGIAFLFYTVDPIKVRPCTVLCALSNGYTAIA